MARPQQHLISFHAATLLAGLLLLLAGAPLGVSGGRLGDGSGHRRKDHEERAPVAASHHLVQELAAFAVEVRSYM